MVGGLGNQLFQLAACLKYRDKGEKVIISFLGNSLNIFFVNFSEPLPFAIWSLIYTKYNRLDSIIFNLDGKKYTNYSKFCFTVILKYLRTYILYSTIAIFTDIFKEFDPIDHKAGNIQILHVSLTHFNINYTISIVVFW